MICVLASTRLVYLPYLLECRTHDEAWPHLGGKVPSWSAILDFCTFCLGKLSWLQRCLQFQQHLPTKKIAGHKLTVSKWIVESLFTYLEDDPKGTIAYDSISVVRVALLQDKTWIRIVRICWVCKNHPNLVEIEIASRWGMHAIGLSFLLSI